VNTSFPRTARLTQRADFDHVFQAPERKSSDRCFTVLGRCRLQDGAARLGLVIAKRQIRRAHERNRIKRLVSYRRLSADDAARRIAAQVGDEKRRQAATYIVDNHGPIEKLAPQVDDIIAQLRAVE